MSKKDKKKKNNIKQPQKEQEKVELPTQLRLFLDQHILFWLMIFPPVAIYKLIKHKIIGKTGTILLTICFILILGYCTFMALNPDFVTNTNLKTQMEQMEYGEVREIDHVGIYENLYMSEVITTTGFYAVYYDYSETGLISINSIIEYQTEIKDDMVYNQFVTVHKTDETNQLLIQVNPAAIKFLIKNSDYGKIEEVLESENGTQVFKTTKGKYRFNYEYYETVNIQKLNNNNEWEDVMNRDYIIEMKDEFKKALNQTKAIPLYYDIQAVTAYGITETEIYYIFENFCGNIYRIVKFNDGRINLEAADNNPVSREDLAQAWEEYQKGLLDNAK